MTKRKNRNLQSQSNHKSLKISHLQLVGFDNFGEPCSMVSQVSIKHIEALKREGYLNFKVGEWFASIGNCNDLKIFGPFKTSEEALDFCINNYNISEFSSIPLW